MTDPASESAVAAIATAVLAVDGVEAMSSGPVGQFRSYLPGGRSVIGVRLDGGHLELNVVVGYGPSLPELGDRIGEAVGAVPGIRTVHVTVDDIRFDNIQFDAIQFDAAQFDAAQFDAAGSDDPADSRP